jgi:acetolactate synthase-1/2/3 large subunit
MTLSTPVSSVSINGRIARELLRHGVEAVFTLMSEDTARLIVEIDHLGIRLYGTRHDSTAAGMADGYARATGRVGVAVIGRGPALTNAMNAIVTAAKAGTPVIALVGDSANGFADPTRARAARSERVGKHIEQAALLQAAGVPVLELRTPETAVDDLAAAFEHARRSGAIAVNMPADVLEAADSGRPGAPTVPDPAPEAPDPNDIALVADLLAESWAASRPVILAGRGAAGARDELRRLGDLTGSLMANTLMADGLFDGDPYDIGVVGTMSTPVGGELMARADLVLAFGASLNPYTTYRGELVRRARVLQFDSSPLAGGRYLPVEMAIRGDARLAAMALVDELERRGHQTKGYRTPEIAVRLRHAAEPLQDRGRPGALDPRLVMRRLDGLLPRERTLVLDGGHHFEWGATQIRVPDPGAFILTNEYFSVGCGLACALGAAVARPDRLTVLEVGDGGMMMNLGDLETAVRYRLPMVVVVLDDGGFGSEIHYLQVNGLPDQTARYASPSFAAIARGMGARAIEVKTLESLDKVPEVLDGLDGPLVLDCKVSSDVRAAWVDFLFTPQPG